jgi:DHA2 family multidrug resistance protein
MLDRGKNADWFGSTWIIALALTAFAGFCAFVLWEWTEDHPIIDLSLFKNRNFTIGTLVFCLGNGVFLANMLLVPLWLQTQLGYTATWAGLVSAPTAVVSVLLTPLAARAMNRADARVVASAAFLASALSYYLRAQLTADASFTAIAIPLMVQGIANAGFFVATVTILLDGVEQNRVPMASGLANFVRIIISGFAVSIVTTWWDRREALHQSRMADMASGPALDNMLSSLGALGMPDLAGKAVLTRGMEGQAYLLASVDMFSVSMGICLGLAGLVWLCHAARAADVAPVVD